MKNILMRLWREEEGQDLLEYALLIVLIVLVAAAAINPLGTAIAKVFTNANTCLSSAGTTCT
jgi:pilus assembly protein Flp/PilA